MDYYINIRVLPDPEFRATILLNSLVSKFHKALCDLQSTSIGVSFPGYKLTLGNILRIHGDQSALYDLQGMDWLGGMKGYCQVSEVKPVPAGVKHRRVSRLQPTMSPAKLRRLIKRSSIKEEGVKTYQAKMFTKGLDNPYIELQSGSNGHKHRRYIAFGPLLDEPVPGPFDQFGLSKTATVPWF